MISFKKIASALALGALVSGAAQAQLSNAIYFQKYNYRTHFLNPAEMPEGKFYMGTFLLPVIPVLGTTAIGVGNNSFCMADLIKNVNVNGRPSTVFVLDQAVANGQQQFLDQIADRWNVGIEARTNLIDFGFRIKEKNYFTFTTSLRAEANTFIPRELFDVILEGVRYDETFNFHPENLGVNANGYLDFSFGYTRKVNDKLSIGGAIKYLKGLASIKTDLKDMDFTGNVDEWILSGNGNGYVSIPTLIITTKANGQLDETDFEDFGDNFKDIKSKFKGNGGFGLDLGASYKITDKIKVSASMIDFGFVNYKNYAYKFDLTNDVKYTGGELDIQNQKMDFSEYDDAFKDALTCQTDAKYKHWLTTKAYLGLEYEMSKWISFGALSKTCFMGNHVWEEASLQTSLHPIRLIDWAIAYNIYDHQWNSVSSSLSLNFGSYNFFIAADNLPLRYAKVTTEDSDFKVPNKLQFCRINFGFGLVLGAKHKKDKNKEIDLSDLEPDFFDADGDGVEDLKDRCAETPAGIDVDEHGCPFDTDKDGVADYKDNCPDTPEGVQVDENGCPVDTDKDGVADYLDKCPDTPEGMPVDANGCPIDEDGDGVTDALDKCPGTPAGVKVTAEGCPVDTDGDGVPDYLDKCPDVPGVKANNGCPEVKKEVLQLFKKALNGIQFQTGKATILRASYPILDQIVGTMIANPTYKLNIYGHTDNVGNAASNLQLSKDRANSVMTYLLNKGISAERLNAEGFGDTKPVVPNNTSANRAKNRRVEFEVEFMASVPQE